MDRWEDGQAACIDVTVVHGLVDAYPPSSTRPPRVDQAEEAKRKKYAELFASQPFAFIPVGLDTLGSLGASAKTFLSDIEGKFFGHHADNSGEDSTGDTIPTSPLCTKLSIALAKMVGCQLAAIYDERDSHPYGPPPDLTASPSTTATLGVRASFEQHHPTPWA